MSPRFSTVRIDTIDYSFWLVFDGEGGMRFARGEPDITRAERKMQLSATLPKSLFTTPVLKASIAVPATDPTSLNITIDAIADSLRQAIGCDIDLRVEEPR